MKHFITPDLLFSYWIFIWAVIYYVITIYPYLRARFSPYVYQSINPLIPLYIALLYNILEFAGLWLAGVSASILLEFIAMIFTLKIVWIFLLRNTKIQLITSNFQYIFEIKKLFGVVEHSFAIFGVPFFVSFTIKPIFVYQKVWFIRKRFCYKTWFRPFNSIIWL